jgi:putative nucleotidyltransferase with HDIG domain
MPTVQSLKVDESRIKKAIISGLPLIFTTYTMPHEIEIYMESAISVFLKLARQENLKDYVCYCVQELTTNAKKANTKRVYFKECGLNIIDPDDYQKGMEHFKETTLNNISHYLQLQKEKGLFIKLIVQIRENIIHLEVRNNSIITSIELDRVHNRLSRSQQYSSLDEAFSQIDDSEGAGLGLVILILMLKKIGLNADCFNIHHNKRETIARILIPLDRVHVENVAVLSKAIVDNISALPPFPENILEIQRLIASEEADMGMVARQISKDPVLTADLLRLVNSAQYMLAKRLDNITDAVKIAGMRSLKNLLFSYGTQQILGTDSAEKKILWEHCFKTAFYAFNIARKLKSNHHIIDDVYVSGMLHDMGKIIFSNVHPNLLEKIRHFCTERNIPHYTFEDLSAGINHAEIGALIAEKWNFPDSLIAAIRYHHHPAAAPENYRNLVESVYLANMFCSYEDGAATFDQFEEDSLAHFGITTKDQLDSLVGRFSQAFTKAKERL